MGYNVNFIAPMIMNEDANEYFSIRLAKPSKVPDNRNLIRWMYSTRSFDYFVPYLKIPKDKIGRVVIFDGWRLEPWDFVFLNAKFKGAKIINILHPPVVFIDKIPIRFFSPLYKRSIWGSLNTRIHEYFLKNGYTSYYLPNGISFPDKNRIVRNPDEFLIFFGRIEPSKAPHLAIKLARILGIPLKIYGRIFNGSYFEKEIKPYLDSVNVIFCGEVPYTELFKNLRMAKGTVYFSETYDPLPTVLLESISFGVPVIGYNSHTLSGFHDIIRNGMNGIIVRPSEISSGFSSDKLSSVLGSLDRDFIYTSAQEKWSWEAIVKKHYKELLEKLMMK